MGLSDQSAPMISTFIIIFVFIFVLLIHQTLLWSIWSKYGSQKHQLLRYQS